LRTRVLILFGCLLAAAGAAARADRYEDVPPRQPLASVPMQILDWRGVQQPPLSQEVLDVLRADDYLTRTYYSAPENAAVGLYIGFWQSQRDGDTIHSPLNCLPGAGWEPIAHATIAPTDTRIGSTVNGSINRYIIQKGIDRQLVLYWYQSHGRIVASEYSSKFYLIADAVRLNRTDGAIVRVIAPIANGSQAAEQRAEGLATRFVHALLPTLRGVLPD
jgi:EpsI family protein